MQNRQSNGLCGHALISLLIDFKSQSNTPLQATGYQTCSAAEQRCKSPGKNAKHSLELAAGPTLFYHIGKSVIRRT